MVKIRFDTPCKTDLNVVKTKHDSKYFFELGTVTFPNRTLLQLRVQDTDTETQNVFP